MNDFECPRCGGELHDLACAGCGTKYEHALDVPFLGSYEAEDTLGLIEIAANISNRDTLYFTPDSVEDLEKLCAQYELASDKAAFAQANPPVAEPWFPYRYNEYLTVHRLLKGISLEGKRVLDVGAGLGFDSQRLALKGAEVTALEFSPILAANGRRSFPNMRWIGGFSHALPFKSGSFDAVCFNAALHHMRDIPTAIAEALRVLRVGGTLITTSDPFRANGTPQSHELKVFDRHTAVLLGINEQIPCFNEFVATLQKHAKKLKVELFTHMLYGGRSGSGPNLAEWTAWDLAEDGTLLGQRAGSLAIRVTLLEPINGGARLADTRCSSPCPIRRMDEGRGSCRLAVSETYSSGIHQPSVPRHAFQV